MGEEVQGKSINLEPDTPASAALLKVKQKNAAKEHSRRHTFQAKQSEILPDIKNRLVDKQDVSDGQSRASSEKSQVIANDKRLRIDTTAEPLSSRQPNTMKDDLMSPDAVVERVASQEASLAEENQLDIDDSRNL